jgi:ribonuclease HII
MEPTNVFETEARRRGYRLVAGLDEAGRGPLAGPVVAAAVILPRRCRLEGLNDSKQVEEADRERLFDHITQRAVGFGIGMASPREIDDLNILEASRLAMVRAVQALAPAPDFLLLDAVTLTAVTYPQRAIIKGDGLSVSIAAASILAKVTRDRLMWDWHRRYPQYNFHLHKGYPTPDHLRLLEQFGPCEIHRLTFGPVRRGLSGQGQTKETIGRSGVTNLGRVEASPSQLAQLASEKNPG